MEEVPFNECRAAVSCWRWSPPPNAGGKKKDERIHGIRILVLWSPQNAESKGSKAKGIPKGTRTSDGEEKPFTSDPLPRRTAGSTTQTVEKKMLLILTSTGWDR